MQEAAAGYAVAVIKPKSTLVVLSKQTGEIVITYDFFYSTDRDNSEEKSLQIDE